MFQLIARHLLHTLNIIVVESFTTPHYYCPMSVQPLPALTVTANRTRNIVLRVPVTAEERAMIERKMQQMGTGCFSVYARKMLITPYFLKALSRVMISVKVPFALPYQATDRFAAVLRLQRSWQSKIYNRKESAMSKYVLKLLESYNERERKIAVLRYNLEHPAKVSRSEQIEAMNFGHGDGLDHSAGHISNKTLYIALNYEEQAERMNAESAHEIAKELFALECEQRRLTYFIGLLDKRQAEVIRLVFVDGIPTKEVAASFGLTYRTIDRIKRTAIENLAEMYAYSDQFRV